MESVLKKEGYKVVLPSDTFTKVVSLLAKPTNLVHSDKIFKGVGLLKTLVDLGWNIQILCQELMFA
jgi:hypothetical protein